jgi:hypothetical protein
MNSLLTLLWALSMILIPATQLCFSPNAELAAFYVFIATFCGVFLFIFRKNIPLFSPIFMLISSVFINICFPALYFLHNKIPLSEELMQNISIIYIIYFFSLIFPLFFANQIFLDPKESKFQKFLSLNFKTQNITVYLILSNIILLASIIFLLKTTGFNYTDALKNPLAFRYAASAGSLAYFRKLTILLFMLNSFILAKLNFTPTSALDKPEDYIATYKDLNPFNLKVFTVFHIIFLLLFAIISGSRSVIFLPIAASIAVYSFYNRIKFTALFKTAFIFFLTLLFISFYAQYRNHKKLDFTSFNMTQNLPEISVFKETVNRLDNYKNSLYFFEYIDREYNTLFYFNDFHALAQLNDHFLQAVPRNMIENKGYYFSTLMTQKVFNSNINESKITYNFGGISNAFWNLGLAGVILEGLLLGTMVVWLHRRFLGLMNHDSFFLLFMTTFFFIPNSVIVDGLWNTMDGCAYFMNIIIAAVIAASLSVSFKKA